LRFEAFGINRGHSVIDSRLPQRLLYVARVSNEKRECLKERGAWHTHTHIGTVKGERET
jgi:hypothetical protein